MITKGVGFGWTAHNFNFGMWIVDDDAIEGVLEV